MLGDLGLLQKFFFEWEAVWNHYFLVLIFALLKLKEFFQI
jgi:hypothetical protein